jgi:hypothetical protein
MNRQLKISVKKQDKLHQGSDKQSRSSSSRGNKYEKAIQAQQSTWVRLATTATKPRTGMKVSSQEKTIREQGTLNISMKYSTCGHQTSPTTHVFSIMTNHPTKAEVTKAITSQKRGKAEGPLECQGTRSTISRYVDWLIDCLHFYVPLKNSSLIWRHHHYR